MTSSFRDPSAVNERGQKNDKKSQGSGFSQPKGAPNNSGGAANRINTAASVSEESNSGNNNFEPGLFNFASIMEDFYNYQPEEGDQLGQLQKSAYQGNLVQTAFDAQLASALADQNAGIAQENMIAQANLEKINATDLMQTEFGFNELSKESNFNYENSFANAQYDRDVGMLAATGEQQRDNIREASNQERLTTIVQGEQDRLKDAQNNQSQEKIATGRYASDDYQADVSADASRDVASTQADADRDVATTQKEASVRGSEAKEQVAETAASASMYGADRQLDATKDTNVTSTRNIRTEGEETRTTMDLENRLKAKDRADMSRYARGTARNY
mgnify:CR=1 FL=1|jgi:hypothetical protein